MKKIYIIETEQVTYYKGRTTMTWNAVLPKFYTTREAAEQEIAKQMEGVQSRTSNKCVIKGSRVLVFGKDALAAEKSFAYRVTELNAAE